MSVVRLQYRDRKDTDRIILHDSHTAPDVGQAEEVSNWFPEAQEGAERMGLMSIGYHYIIERDGKVRVGREVHKQGSHTPGHNMNSIGVCLVGGRDGDDYPEENFTYEQRKAFIRLHGDLQQRYGKKLEVVGHTEVQRYRDRDKPPCPYLDMDLLREDLNLYSQGIIL